MCALLGIGISDALKLHIFGAPFPLVELTAQYWFGEKTTSSIGNTFIFYTS